MNQPTRALIIKNYMIPIIVLGIGILEIIAPYKGWVVLLVGLGGVWLWGYIWALSLSNNLHLQREMSFGLSKVGDQIQEQFVIWNKSRLPALWVTLIDHSDFPYYNIDTARFIEERALKRWIKGGVCYKRGYYNFGPTSLIAEDPFGIYECRIFYPKKSSILVVPPIVPLPMVEVAVGELVDQGTSRFYNNETTVSAANVRPFVQGDSQRLIHWPTSARKNKIYVKQFDTSLSSEWWVILDMSEMDHVGEEETSTLEYGIILAAALADRGIEMNKAVGLVALGDPTVWLRPKTGKEQLWDILYSLSIAQKGQINLNDTLSHIDSSLSTKTSAIIITPNVSEIWLDSVYHLVKKGVSLTVLILDPEAFEGEGDLSHVTYKLDQWGVNYYIIEPEMIDFPIPDERSLWRTKSGLTQSKYFDGDLNMKRLG